MPRCHVSKAPSLTLGAWGVLWRVVWSQAGHPRNAGSPFLVCGGRGGLADVDGNLEEEASLPEVLRDCND